MNPILINLLLSIGGSLGASFVSNPKLQGLITTAISGTENLITILSNKTSGSVAAPAFMAVLQAAFGVLEVEGKISASEAAALNKAISDTLAADAAGQVTVDPSTLTPIAPLP